MTLSCAILRSEGRARPRRCGKDLLECVGRRARPTMPGGMGRPRRAKERMEKTPDGDQVTDKLLKPMEVVVAEVMAAFHTTAAFEWLRYAAKLRADETGNAGDEACSEEEVDEVAPGAWQVVGFRAEPS